MKCERLSADSDHLRLVEDFWNGRNQNLEHTLKNEAYEQDEMGQIAYYLVKNADGDILFYFSLKCGLLYDNFNEWEQLRKINEFYAFLLELNQQKSTSFEDKVLIESILESIRTRQGLKKEDILKIKRSPKDDIVEELKKESEDHLKRVGKTFAGIELVHFCVNEQMHDFWNAAQMNQKMGVVVFWYFIVPKILEVMKIVGCEYLFLFAADPTPDEFLVNYYRTFLGFKDENDHSTAISLYDFACKFMYQKTSDLAARRASFFNHFNLDEDEV